MKTTRVLCHCAVGCAWLVLATLASAEVRMPRIFSDQMVLQRDMPIPVWGWAAEGDKVTVEFAGQTASATAGPGGKWTVTLKPLSAGGPHTLSVKGQTPADAVQARDVLVGEVWVCSGQSNMEWPVNRADNAEEEISAANYPSIRHFKVAHKIAETPQEDCVGEWEVCSPGTVADFTAVGYFFARLLHRDLDVPVGIIGCNWGGTLAEAWTGRERLEANNAFDAILERSREFNPNSPHQASVLYNGMLHPLIPFAIRGAIWYQGESNVTRAQQYAQLFPAMIQNWRAKWQQGDFPFYYVQLAPFRYDRNDPQACAELWEAQLKTLSLPNTGMAVTTDIGDIQDIHPTNKQEVGRRLALWALAKTYGRGDLVFSGPLYDSMNVEQNKIRIRFRHVGGGLTTRDGQPPSDFAIAGKDEEFHEATATIDGDTLIVYSEDVDNPVAVRYAWRDDAEPNLSNTEGLPASPFRTDDFKMVTDGSR
jgi:sialate O-acetylesterase